MWLSLNVRAKNVANLALSNVYSTKNYQDSKMVIFNVSGDESLNLLEINNAAEIIAEKVGSDAEILFTATLDENLKDEVRVSIMSWFIDADRLSILCSILISK